MIQHKALDDLRKAINDKNDDLTPKRMKWIKRNSYFYKELLKSLKYIIDEDSSVLHIRCGIGYILNELSPKTGFGVDGSPLQVAEAKKLYPNYIFECQEPELCKVKGTFDYILISHVEDIVDVKAVFEAIKPLCNEKTRVIVTSYNYLWHPIVKFSEKLKLKTPQKQHNWFTINDLNNIISLSNFDLIYNKKMILFPFYLPIFSYLINRFTARLPFFRIFDMMNVTVCRPKVQRDKDYSVSIVIPCKNEAGNIQDAVERIPEIGSKTEIIFCDDKSTDGTAEEVREMIKKYPKKDIKLVDGPGICKSENVWTGFDAATCDILMILDADLTVIPEELGYFYEAIVNDSGEFINGSRLVYPMFDNAMRPFNILGNKFFSMLFSFILDIKIKDTLCGTKVMWRSDYQKIKKLRGTWGIMDRWGDYELIFGAAKTHLKIIDLPIHYMERVYGDTKMTNRIKNGLIMLRMSMKALFKIKFY